MSIQTHFSGIYKPVQVPSKDDFEGKKPAVFPQKHFPNRRELFELTGSEPRLRWDTFDSKGNLLFLTDEDMDGYTDAINARTEIQETVNELDAAMKEHGLTQVPTWGPVGEINRRADAMKREVLYAYLESNQDRIESVPYYIEKSWTAKLIRAVAERFRKDS